MHGPGDDAVEVAVQAGAPGFEQRVDDEARVARIGVAEARWHGLAAHAQRQLARAGRGVFVAQAQGQPQALRGREQGVGIGNRDQRAGMRALREPHAEFGADAARFARD